MAAMDTSVPTPAEPSSDPRPNLIGASRAQLAEWLGSLGEKPLCFRGSLVVPGRKRPLRHLVSCSQELAETTSDGKLLLVSDDNFDQSQRTWFVKLAFDAAAIP